MRISKRDWAQLSAFVDGELNQRETEKIRKRIENNPEFQATLEDLKTVKTVLAHTPELPVPRDFKLQQSIVQIPHRASPVRGYSLAAAALSFLFIGVLVIDFGSGMLKGGLSAAQAPMAEEVMLEAAADELEEPALIAKEAAVEEEMAPEAEMAEDPESSPSLEAGKEGEEVEMMEADNSAPEDGADRAYSGGEDSLEEGEQDIPNTPAPTAEAEVAEDPNPSDPDRSQEDQLLLIPWMLIREITLGFGAVGFAVAAWIKRRKNRII